MRRISSAVAAVFLLLAACTDTPTSANSTPDAVISPITARIEGLHRSATPTSAVRWNRKAVALFRARGGGNRALSYLGLAQYRAVRAALGAWHGRSRPSLAGAAAGASVVILQQFYPLDSASINVDFEAQRATPGGDDDEDDTAAFDAGVTIGRAIGASVKQQAATDGVGLTDPGAAPVGAGYWFTNGTPAVRGNLGARPFFLRSGSELRAGPPPAFGSAAYLAALSEVRTLSQNRTPEQLAIVRKWVPFASPPFDSLTADLIDKYRRSEYEAAAIFAYAQTAEFDALVACFDSKYAYWFIRPAQADAGVSLGTGMPNHPSYPSGHSCADGAWAGILDVAFPRERVLIDATAKEATESRLLGGLHYRFDADVGAAIGRRAALLAITRRGIE